MVWIQSSVFSTCLSIHMVVALLRVAGSVLMCSKLTTELMCSKIHCEMDLRRGLHGWMRPRWLKQNMLYGDELSFPVSPDEDQHDLKSVVVGSSSQSARSTI